MKRFLVVSALLLAATALPAVLATSGVRTATTVSTDPETVAEGEANGFGATNYAEGEANGFGASNYAMASAEQWLD